MIFKNLKQFHCRHIPLFLAIHVRNRSWSVLFFGNDQFSLYSLKELHKCWQIGKLFKKLDIVTTVSAKPNPVQLFAENKNLRILKWPPVLETSSDNYDIGVVVSFGHLIPKKIIDFFPLGMINVHASLLPRWRGASPIIHSIMAGDVTTGVSIMRIKPHHFDTGDVLIQRSCPIGPDELMPSLHFKLGILGAKCLLETLKTLPQCLESSIAQNEDSVTFAPRIKPEVAQIQWSEQTSEQVYNLFRALSGFLVLRTTWHGQLVKIKEVKKTADDIISPNTPGAVHWSRSRKQLRVHCKTGSVIIDHLTVGGKNLKGIDFYNGYLTRRPPEQWYFV